MTLDRVVLVIPALNERETIRDVTEQALRYIDDVIVIDDGSTDGTSKALAGLSITLLKNTKNLGKAASLWLGFRHAINVGAKAVVTIDGDGQHAPEDIPVVLAVANQWNDSLILGTRIRKDWRAGISIRVVANRVADFWISWAAGYRIADSQTGFRVYPVSLLQQLTIKHGKNQGFVFESEVLIEAAKLGVRSIPVDIEARDSQGMRPSHFRPIIDVLLITQMVAWRLLSRGLYLRGLYQVTHGYFFSKHDPKTLGAKPTPSVKVGAHPPS